MRLLSLVVAAYQLATIVSAAELRIQISPSHRIPNPNTLPPSTHATLISNSGEIRSLLRKDNTIVFSKIPSAGSHLLQIYTRDYAFAPYRVDIAQSGSNTQISGIWETYPGTKWSDVGVALIPANSPVSTYTLVPKVLTTKTFYEDRPGFSIMILLKNPMILLGGVALLFTFGMPKLLENLDPEMKAEFEEMQKKGPTSTINRAMAGQAGGGADSFDLAGYLAGSKSGAAKSSGREAAGNARERRK